jgi:hypothetical protein
VGDDSSLLHSVQTGSGAHPASYPIGSEGHSPPSSAEVKSGGAILPPAHPQTCVLSDVIRTVVGKKGVTQILSVLTYASKTYKSFILPSLF